MQILAVEFNITVVFEFFLLKYIFCTEFLLGRTENLSAPFIKYMIAHKECKM